MEQLQLSPILYVLKLEDDCWYIGMSYCINVRFAQHWAEKGAKWTKLHKPMSVEQLIYPAKPEDENIVTKKYMEKYGFEKVRGGSWCKV